MPPKRGSQRGNNRNSKRPPQPKKNSKQSNQSTSNPETDSESENNQHGVSTRQREESPVLMKNSQNIGSSNKSPKASSNSKQSNSNHNNYNMKNSKTNTKNTSNSSVYKTLKKRGENDKFMEEEINLANQLKNLGLEIREITADGNCMFSAISDQIYGSEKRAKELRTGSCLYIMQNKEKFLPFIGENDAEFKRFIQTLNRQGVYGGQEALVAIANDQNIRISIHQVGQPIWKIWPDNRKNVKKEIHLAYHSDALHYSSIRRKGDINCAGSNITLPDSDQQSSSIQTTKSSQPSTSAPSSRKNNRRRKKGKSVNVIVKDDSKEADNLNSKIDI